MGLESSSVRMFAGHQTFHPRFGWIKKGFDACARDREIFRRSDAPVVLGVGKNMVEAIKFWTIATHMGVRVPNRLRRRTHDVVPTSIGSVLIGERGLDPYLEDSTTLWILHWLGVSAPSLLPVWRATFNDFSVLSFEEEDLLRFAEDEVAGTTWTAPHPSSIRKDVDCLLRMYSSKPRRGRQTIDDVLDSPFRELGLIVEARDGNGYRFVRGSKPGLTPTAVAFACLDFIASENELARTVTLTRLMLDDGSPGRLFKLGSSDLQEALETPVVRSAGLRIASPAGSSQLMLDTSIQEAAVRLLQGHYSQRASELYGPWAQVVGAGAREPDAAHVEVLDLREPAIAVGDAPK